jgi:outer membrane protein assembly factor BamA
MMMRTATKERRLFHGLRDILWFICLVPALVFSQQRLQIKDIRFHGLTQISQSETRRIVPLPILDPGISDSLRMYFAPLLAEYQRLGFYTARIDSVQITGDSNSSGEIMDLWMTEGRPVVVDSIGFRSMRLFSVNEVLSFFETQLHSVLIDAILERDISILITEYSERGYPFASVTVEEITLCRHPSEERDGLTVTLNVVEGPRVMINRIDVSGNETTRADVIIRESRIRIGDIYCASEIETARQRLLRLGFFNSVGEPEILMAANGGGLKFRVTETAMNTFDGIIGYLPPSQGYDHGMFTGMVNILLKNMFGTGRRLGARWQHESTSTQELRLQYFEPWVAGLPLNIGLGFFQRQQDTAYVQRTYDARAEVTAFDNLTLSALFSYDQVIPSASTAGLLIPKSISLSTGIEILYDTRDEPVAPIRGYLYRSDVRIGRKTFDAGSTAGEEHLSLQRYTLDFEWYIPTFSRQVIASSVHARELRSSSMIEPDLFRFGGARTLRGYRENQFLGSRIVWGSLEYRLSVGRRSFAYVFTDIGYYLHPGDQGQSLPETQASKIGYGIGFQLETGLGIVRVSYALGEGDTFTTGKIHFGLINDF